MAEQGSKLRQDFTEQQNLQHQQQLIQQKADSIQNPGVFSQNFKNKNRYQFDNNNVDENDQLITNQPLEIQQKELMKAFIKNDQKYIYEFDKESLNYREKKLIQPVGQLAFASLLFLGSSNFLFYKLIARNPQFEYAVKLGMFCFFNLVPQSYFYYKANQAYNNTQEYLFNKYLKESHN
ncbi:hypothetical protein PPERSA_03633 [Pseudocohnilembus persalinus]|uniref:Transmembrane protein n=1 Tax=Pseudocohnilembus persalinus TaxID=266149 RepID=A0A0V0QDZ7_PSEPJ|nr:hypothetical protein PPERSA_03633 [Pseudocohnilembus persalinus]|eukprot:KRX00412.1 hypothetical protein PPERSA_03633 [Pseudocohnilembus persalinus]